MDFYFHFQGITVPCLATKPLLQTHTPTPAVQKIMLSPFLFCNCTTPVPPPAQFMQYADANMKSSSSSSSSAARSTETETERHCIILKNTPTPGFAHSCDQRHCKSVVDKKKSVKHGFLLRGIWYLLVHKVRTLLYCTMCMLFSTIFFGKRPFLS